MSRALLIVVTLAIVAAAASSVTIYLVHVYAQATPQMSEQQRITRENFFGAAEKLPPSENGQEMRPRW